MMRGAGSNVLKTIAGLFAAWILFSVSACKQSATENNKATVETAMPEMQVQKDSLNAEFQQTKQKYVELRGRFDQIPADKLKKPGYAELSKTFEKMRMKSETLDDVVPAMEARLAALTKENLEKPSEELKHEIEVTKQMLQAQRKRMENYQDAFLKMEARLDSIEGVSQK